MIKKNIGIFTGIGAGMIDVVPMLIQKLPWQADLSAFVTWVVIGFIISKIEIGAKGPLKGLIVALLVVAPVALIVGESDPASLLPIGVMTLVLGSLSGWIIEKVKS